MNQTTDVVVVGGGVIGCFIAYELSKAGLEVTVVEKGEVGAEASSAAAGLLVPLHVADDERTPLFDLYLASTRIFPEIVPELEAETGIRLEYAQDGVLRVSLSEEEAVANFSKFQTWGKALGMEMMWLDKAQTHQLEPELAPTICGSILSPEEGVINNGRLVLALARAAANRNAHFLEGHLATGICSSGGQFSSLKTTQGEITADQLVIATGAWSQVFCKSLDISIPVSPARGQMLAVKTIRHLVQRPVNSSRGAIVPRGDGSVHVGATVEHVGFDKRNTPKAIADLLERAITLVPGLTGGRIEKTWSGLRPYCTDGLPVIGVLPGWKNVTVATGHFTMGITGSPITAKIIKALIVDGRWKQSIEGFSPGRFAKH